MDETYIGIELTPAGEPQRLLPKIPMPQIQEIVTTCVSVTQNEDSKLLICNNLEPCDSGATRTRDPQLRRLLLYPTELRNRTFQKGLQI